VVRRRVDLDRVEPHVLPDEVGEYAFALAREVFVIEQDFGKRS
jgi:hypothetical protein